MIRCSAFDTDPQAAERYRRVDADLTEVAAGGAPSRRTPQEKIAVFVNGLGIEDLAAAIELHRLAEHKQAGSVPAPQWS